MLNVNAIGQKSKLRSDLTASALTIPLVVGEAQRFAVGTGNHTYVTLRGVGGIVERIKVSNPVGNDLIAITRGVDGTTPQVWSSGTCVAMEWNPAMMCEYHQLCASGAPAPTSITAQTVCMSSCVCLDIAANGTITAVNRSTGCP
jgi:hypothetical protein